MPIRQLINVRTAARMISLLRNKRAESTTQKTLTSEGLESLCFDWYKTDGSVKKWTSLPATNECRRNVKLYVLSLPARSFFVLFVLLYSGGLCRNYKRAGSREIATISEACRNSFDSRKKYLGKMKIKLIEFGKFKSSS